MPKRFLILSALILSVAIAMPAAMASEGGEHPPQRDWRFDGPFGTYDRAALQRGLQVYRQVCSSCHSMKRIAYRNLAALGYSAEEIKALAAEDTVMDGPDDEGEMFERAALPSDKFAPAFANEQAAKAANNGALPPDLSLIVKARAGGANYIAGLMTGYEDAPAEEEMLDGQYWNKYFAGHKIAMAPPLMAGSVEYEDGTAGSVEQYAKDVSHFLAWASAPEMEDRKRIGIKALLFLLMFSGIMYAVKKKIWSDLH